MSRRTEVILTPSRKFKAVLQTRFDGSVRISVYKWTEHIPYAEISRPFWEIVNKDENIFATRDNAEKIAREELRRISGESFTEVMD